MILKLGDPAFPVALVEGRFTAKVEHVWHAARRYANRYGYFYTSSYGVEGVAPT